MTLQDPVIFLFLSAALVGLSVHSLNPWRAEIFLFLSLAFIFLQYGFAVPSLAVLVAAVTVHYVTLRSMMRLQPGIQRAIIFWTWLVLILVGFAVVKHYYWLTGHVLPRRLVVVGLSTIGLSFLLFRQINLSVDVRDGLIESVPAVKYLNYNLAFWTFLAGPIQRFEPFCVQFDRMSAPGHCVQSHTLLVALNRLMTGLIKMFVVGRFLEKYTGSEAFLANPSFRNLCTLLLAFPLYIYINFSGYCDVMVGLARAVGFDLPENFRHPYLARNSIDFWSRWHITLSEFFRDYMYFPFYVVMARKGVWPWMATGVAVLCSFAAMGAWHGTRLGFVIFGLLHGIGVIAALAYEAFLRAALAKETLKWYRSNPSINVASVVCFQIFVVLSFLPFQFSGEQLRSIVRAVRTL